MPTSRVEAFSDGVLAIIITIMVMTLEVPSGSSLSDLWQTTGLPLLSYILSFAYVGIYWNSHHHLFQSVDTVTGASLWANLALLFCLSLLPFTTAWMDGTLFARAPVAVYGVVLLASAVAYTVLESVLVRAQPEGSAARRALRSAAAGMQTKNRVSLCLYALGTVSAAADGVVLAAGVGVPAALVCYVAVALMWLVPDRRIEDEVGRQARRP